MKAWLKHTLTLTVLLMFAALCGILTWIALVYLSGMGVALIWVTIPLGVCALGAFLVICGMGKEEEEPLIK